VEHLNFTDMQVITLIKKYPGLNLYQLKKKAEEEMPKWPWTIGKIQKAVERLKKDHKIETVLKVNGGRACQEVYLRGTV
jgi:hypothetical protein